MALRASWTGHLKISLVTIPVRLYNAVSSTARITLNQLHRGCGERVRYDLVCPVHGRLEREDVVKGYEYERGRYVELEEEDLAQVRLETTKVIEVVQFSPLGDIDLAYLDAPYYLAPDGPIAAEAFATFRDAMAAAGRAGVGRVVLGGREKLVVMQPLRQGLMMNTLHYAYEIRRPEPYFEEVPARAGAEDQLQLGELLIERMSRPFSPDQFSDRYQEALLEVIKAKIAGRPPERAPERPVAAVVNLMDALKRSLEQEAGGPPPEPKAPGKKPPAESVPPAKERRRRGAG